jgi:hypothetical protein
MDSSLITGAASTVIAAAASSSASSAFLRNSVPARTLLSLAIAGGKFQWIDEVRKKNAYGYSKPVDVAEEVLYGTGNSTAAGDGDASADKSDLMQLQTILNNASLSDEQKFNQTKELMMSAPSTVEAGKQLYSWSDRLVNSNITQRVRDTLSRAATRLSRDQLTTRAGDQGLWELEHQLWQYMMGDKEYNSFAEVKRDIELVATIIEHSSASGGFIAGAAGGALLVAGLTTSLVVTPTMVVFAAGVGTSIAWRAHDNAMERINTESTLAEMRNMATIGANQEGYAWFGELLMQLDTQAKTNSAVLTKGIVDKFPSMNTEEGTKELNRAFYQAQQMGYAMCEAVQDAIQYKAAAVVQHQRSVFSNSSSSSSSSELPVTPWVPVSFPLIGGPSSGTLPLTPQLYVQLRTGNLLQNVLYSYSEWYNKPRGGRDQVQQAKQQAIDISRMANSTVEAITNVNLTRAIEAAANATIQGMQPVIDGFYNRLDSVILAAALTTIAAVMYGLVQCHAACKRSKRERMQERLTRLRVERMEGEETEALQREIEKEDRAIKRQVAKEEAEVSDAIASGDAARMEEVIIALQARNIVDSSTRNPTQTLSFKRVEEGIKNRVKNVRRDGVKQEEPDQVDEVAFSVQPVESEELTHAMGNAMRRHKKKKGQETTRKTAPSRFRSLVSSMLTLGSLPKELEENYSTNLLQLFAMTL